MRYRSISLLPESCRLHRTPVDLFNRSDVGGFGAFVPLGYFELDLVTFLKAPAAFDLDGAGVDEDIFAAV